jgi:hypothetical protein
MSPCELAIPGKPASPILYYSAMTAGISPVESTSHLSLNGDRDGITRQSA